MLIREQGILQFSGQWSIPPCILRRDGGRELDLHYLCNVVFSNIAGKFVREYADAGRYTIAVDEKTTVMLGHWSTAAYLIDIANGETITFTLPSMLLVNRACRLDVEIGDLYVKIRRCA